MVKNDRWIKEMALKGMIEPFADRMLVKTGISFGLGSYGYDMRLSEDFKLLKTASDGSVGGHPLILDPKNCGPADFESVKSESCVIPAGSFVLGRSLEYFRLPRDIIVLSTGKSTYARCGVIVNVTPLEPEWQGHVTICIANTGPLPVKIYAGEGISQLVFLGAGEVCQVSYADKAGKYQAQKEITHSRT
ncbi:MAG: dCTP deaminase [Nitrospiraceae bacterium]|nr:dCTP deaminase [Nitrospiraceae bacterium]